MGIIGVRNNPRMATFILIRVTDSIVTSCIAKRIIHIRAPTQQTLNMSL
jgi:hypothetical protein